MTKPESPVCAALASFDSLLRYNEHETAHWHDWFSKQPQSLLQVPAGDPSREMATLRDLLFSHPDRRVGLSESTAWRAVGRRVEGIWSNDGGGHFCSGRGSPTKAACLCRFSKRRATREGVQDCGTQWSERYRERTQVPNAHRDWIACDRGWRAQTMLSHRQGWSSSVPKFHCRSSR